MPHNPYSHRIEIQRHTIPATHPQLNYYHMAAASTPRARVLLLHGYGEHAGRYGQLMQFFSDHGIATFAPDFRGHGRSAGKPGFVRNWDEHLTDLAAFLSIPELSTTTDPTPLFILAHSHGGLVATIAAIRGQLDHCRGVILSAPYLDLKMPVPLYKRVVGNLAAVLHPTMQIKSGLHGPMLTRDPAMIAEGRGDPFIRGIATPRWFFATQKIQTQARAMAGQFKLPLLLLVPGHDAIANPKAAIAFFEQCASVDKTMLQYPEHFHELLREVGREEIYESILEWIMSRVNSKDEIRTLE